MAKVTPPSSTTLTIPFRECGDTIKKILMKRKNGVIAR